MGEDLMARSVRATEGPEIAPLERRFRLIRSNYRSHAQNLHARYPEAADLNARIVAIIGEETKGEGEIFRGPGLHSLEVWEDILDGTKQAPLHALTRVLTSRRPKARRASERIMAELALCCPEVMADSEVADELPTLIERSGAVFAGLTRDLKDKLISEEEATRRLPKIRDLKRRIDLVLTRYETHVRSARREVR